MKLGKEKREKNLLLKKLSVRNGTCGVVTSSLQFRPIASRFSLEGVNLSNRLLTGAMTEFGSSSLLFLEIFDYVRLTYGGLEF